MISKGEARPSAQANQSRGSIPNDRRGSGLAAGVVSVKFGATDI